MKESNLSRREQSGNDWIIDGWIRPGETFGLFGEPKTCKSFVLLDMGLWIACGKPWHGSATKAGKVLYVDGSRTQTVGIRAQGWCQHNDAVRVPDHQFSVISDFIQLESPEAVQGLTNTIEGDESVVILDLSIPFDLGDRGLAEYAASLRQGLAKVRRAFAGALGLSVGTYGPADRASTMLGLDTSMVLDAKGSSAVNIRSLSKDRGPSKQFAMTEIKIDEDWSTLVLEG